MWRRHLHRILYVHIVMYETKRMSFFDSTDIYGNCDNSRYSNSIPITRNNKQAHLCHVHVCERVYVCVCVCVDALMKRRKRGYTTDFVVYRETAVELNVHGIFCSDTSDDDCMTTTRTHSSSNQSVLVFAFGTGGVYSIVTVQCCTVLYCTYSTAHEEFGCHGSPTMEKSDMAYSSILYYTIINSFVQVEQSFDLILMLMPLFASRSSLVTCCFSYGQSKVAKDSALPM